jgi:hypothetical protein
MNTTTQVLILEDQQINWIILYFFFFLFFCDSGSFYFQRIDQIARPYEMKLDASAINPVFRVFFNVRSVILCSQSLTSYIYVLALDNVTPYFPSSSNSATNTQLCMARNHHDHQPLPIWSIKQKL